MAKVAQTTHISNSRAPQKRDGTPYTQVQCEYCGVMKDERGIRTHRRKHPEHMALLASRAKAQGVTAALSTGERVVLAMIKMAKKFPERIGKLTAENLLDIMLGEAAGEALPTKVDQDTKQIHQGIPSSSSPHHQQK